MRHIESILYQTKVKVMRREFYNRLFRPAMCAVVVWLSLPLATLAQQQNGCGSETQMIEKEYPGFQLQKEAFMQEFQLWLQQADIHQFELSESGARIIPVVVHVLHEGGTENISKSQIQSQMVALNKDFNANNSALTTPSFVAHPTFDTLVANCNIEFRLATLDPQGNCTDGIVRVYTPKTNQAKDFTKFKQTSYWDREKYFNVWVVKSIFNDTQWGTILGYAQFPFAFGSQYPLTSTDGVAVLHNVFGTSGTAVGNTGATLTHEAGHWLGLFHIWGDEDCGSDGIDDTPVHSGPNFSGGSCFPIPKTATCYDVDLYMRDTIGEMWMNFMDYTADQCLWMFSKGQKSKIEFVLNTISFRGSLITSANNIQTGTDDAAYASPCSPAPIADFWSRTGTNEVFTTKLLCAGQSLTFAHGTYNATPSSLDWMFEGGSPATSTSSAPVVTYNTAGVYDVTLTATNAVGSHTKERQDYVRVYNDVADVSSHIYYEPFEYGSLYEQGKWLAVNEGNLNNRWEWFETAGYLSTKSMRLKNDNNITFETDALISPMFDLTTIENDKLTFKYAYAKMTDNPYVEQNDELSVYVSTNCGLNWSRRQITVDGTATATLKGVRLITAGLAPGGFIPTTAAQWKEASVNITPYLNEDNVRLMFLWKSGGQYGNDFYIDDVLIENSQAIGVEENITGQTDFSIFPNPVTQISQVYFQLLTAGDVKVDILDITGRIVFNLYAGNLKQGEQIFELDRSKLGASGVYFVRLQINGVASTQKIIAD